MPAPAASPTMTAALNRVPGPSRLGGWTAHSARKLDADRGYAGTPSTLGLSPASVTNAPPLVRAFRRVGIDFLKSCIYQNAEQLAAVLEHRPGIGMQGVV